MACFALVVFHTDLTTSLLCKRTRAQQATAKFEANPPIRPPFEGSGSLVTSDQGFQSHDFPGTVSTQRRQWRLLKLLLSFPSIVCRREQLSTWDQAKLGLSISPSLHVVRSVPLWTPEPNSSSPNYAIQDVPFLCKTL